MDDRRDRSLEGIVDEAAEWVVRLSDAEADGRERQSFVTWLKRSPVHLREYLRAEQAWADLCGIDTERRIDVDALLAQAAVNVVPLDVAAESAPRRVPARALPRMLAVAAAAALLAAGLSWNVLFPDRGYATAVGEQRKIQLEDGSSVLLNTDTRLDVQYTDAVRQVRLLAGEALFSVEKDAARPFRVLSDRAVVQAVGTAFLVRRKPEHTVVTVLEGEVAVAPVGRADAFSAGRLPADALRARAGAQVDVARADMRKREVENPVVVAAWRRGQLIFDGVPLAEVVAEFNRYNRVQLVIDDPALSAERISGVFDSDRPQALVGFLEHSAAIQPPERTHDRIVLVPRR